MRLGRGHGGREVHEPAAHRWGQANTPQGITDAHITTDEHCLLACVLDPQRHHALPAGRVDVPQHIGITAALVCARGMTGERV